MKHANKVRNFEMEDSFNELDIECHIKEYGDLIKTGNRQNDEYFLRQAYLTHSLVIQDALNDALTKAIILLQSLNNADARNFMQFGVARRLSMMWASYREIINYIPPPIGLNHLQRMKLAKYPATSIRFILIFAAFWTIFLGVCYMKQDQEKLGKEQKQILWE